MIRAGRWDRWASQLASTVVRQGVATKVAPRSLPPPDHDLTLYDFEASPWCRLVREYATILDLTLTVKPCPRETLLFGEGSFGCSSRFRPEAMNWYKKRSNRDNNNNNNNNGNVDENENHENDHLTFPLLVDRTGIQNDNDGVVVLTESYEILEHLWDRYGGSVLPIGTTETIHPRPDQIANDPSRSFAARFLSLAGPSYLRPWPKCGLLRLSKANVASGEARSITTTLYQAENCPESRLVREALCGLEIPYRSVPVAEGSLHSLPQAQSPKGRRKGEGDDSVLESAAVHTTTKDAHDENTRVVKSQIPVLHVFERNPSGAPKVRCEVGADACLGYLNETIAGEGTTLRQASWFDPIPEDNLGRSGGPNFSVVSAAFAALRKGRRAFVPDRAME